MNKLVFINNFISMGMASYFENTKKDIFEGHVIECLSDIYGRNKMKAIYDARDEAAFISLLHVYGMQRSLYDNLLRDMMKYEAFMEENRRDPSVKSDIASKIEVTIITMFLHKCLLVAPSLEEISHFENDLLNNFEVIKLHFNTSLSPGRTREIWNKKKSMLTDNVKLVEIKPEYLDDFTYAKYGTSLKDVKKMDYRMVRELNSYIESKQSLEVENDQKKKKSIPKLNKQTVLSSGNGFVDALLIAGIIATEMSIGLIYLFLNMWGGNSYDFDSWQEIWNNRKL